MSAIDFGEMMAKAREERRTASEQARAKSPGAPAAVLSATSTEQHLVDLAEPAYRLPNRQDRSRLTAAHVLPGAAATIYCVAEWVTPAEEQDLMRCADESPKSHWTPLRHRRLQNHGGTPTGEGMRPVPLPGWLASVSAALTAADVFTPALPANHALVNEYLPGQGIDPHRDGPLYQPRVVPLMPNLHMPRVTRLAFSYRQLSTLPTHTTHHRAAGHP